MTYTYDVLLLGSIRVTAVYPVILPVLEVHPVDPDVVLVPVLLDVVVQVQNIVT